MTHITKRHYFKYSASSLAASADTKPIISQCPSPAGSKTCRSIRTRNPEIFGVIDTINNCMFKMPYAGHS